MAFFTQLLRFLHHVDYSVLNLAPAVVLGALCFNLALVGRLQLIDPPIKDLHQVFVAMLPRQSELAGPNDSSGRTEKS